MAPAESAVAAAMMTGKGECEEELNAKVPDGKGEARAVGEGRRARQAKQRKEDL